MQRQLLSLGLKATIPTVGRWLQREGGRGKRPTLGVPRGRQRANGAAALPPEQPSAPGVGGSGGVVPSTGVVDVRSSGDVPELLRNQLTELQAQVRIHQERGNVAAVASLQRAINTTAQLLTRTEQPDTPDENATPDVMALAAAAREKLRSAVTRAVERRARGEA